MTGEETKATRAETNAAPGETRPSGGETKPPIFDAARPIKMRIHTPTGLRILSLRWPTDDEWLARENAKRIIFRALPDGSEEMDFDSEEADADLVAKILTEPAEIDSAEAVIVVERLIHVQVGEPTLEGSLFTVSLSVPGGLTNHVLRMPTAKERLKYRKSAFHVYHMPHKRRRQMMDLPFVSGLYKAMATKATGYANGVPVIHQSWVLGAVFDRIEKEEKDPQNFW